VQACSSLCRAVYVGGMNLLVLLSVELSMNILGSPLFLNSDPSSFRLHCINCIKNQIMWKIYKGKVLSTPRGFDVYIIIQFEAASSAFRCIIQEHGSNTDLASVNFLNVQNI
jgi:hypothetical protein